MAKRGRPPKPTHLKILEGNPGKRPLNSKEPKPKISKQVPKCPPGMSKEAQRVWRREAKILHRLGLLTEIDHRALQMYSETVADWEKMAAILKETGWLITNPKNNHFYLNPLLGASNVKMREARAWMSEFGLTPSARVKLSVDGEINEDDPMAELLNRKA